MPSTRQSAKRQKSELHNQHQPIFKLPPEVLSQIFVFSSRFWDWEFDPESCQGVIPAVCRRWRKVALDTAALWTRIGIADPAISLHRAALHLSRCGPTSQLELMIDLFGHSWDVLEEGATEECVRRANYVFSFITDRGGVTSRWKRCSIQTTRLHAYLAILQFLESSNFPSLEYLEVVYSQSPQIWEVEQAGVSEILESTPRLLFRDPPPKLKTVRLLGVPNSYIFGHAAHPQFTGLTHLQLGLVAQDHELWHLNGLLAANPQLKALSLCSVSMVDGADSAPPDGELAVRQFPKVHLHNLQSLCLPDIDSAPWALSILMMLDAPNVDALRIGYAGDPEGREDYRRLLFYVAWSREAPPAKDQPYFPNLTHLSYESDGDPIGDLQLLLSAYPTLQSLEIPLHPCVEPVLKKAKPWMVPNLKRLRVLWANSLTELKKTVVARHKAKLRLESVEVVCSKPIPNKKPNDKKKLEELVNLVVVESGEELKDLIWRY
ncbi:unnamed protein product [Rhizoctonia solani]|uniref:F-box domain-containing protein n=1 Tax=Rhizoctonia solani TaxID=456999 RepID=A0A8H2XB53_9AGAM|nr:unnamed protein product [Rhizoctonia solani]